MNFNIGGMPWFGNICRQLESMCRDESIKLYIERKVQNVGESVMTFYAKLAEVIVTPTMVIEEPRDVPIDMSMPSTLENVALAPEENHLVHDSDDSEERASEKPLDSLTDMLLALEDLLLEQVESQLVHESDDFEESASEKPLDSLTAMLLAVEDLLLEQVENQLVHESDDSEESVSGATALECLSSASSATYVSSVSMQVPTDVANSPISCNEIVSEMGSNMLLNKAFAVYYDYIDSQIDNNGIDIIEGYNSYYIRSQIDLDESDSSSFASSMESFGTFVGPSDGYSRETNVFSEEANDLSHPVELEESYIIVDHITPHDDISNKRILEALSSIKRLEREYKEVATLQHNATECCQGTSLPASHTMPLRDSQTIQLSDSEWELI